MQTWESVYKLNKTYTKLKKLMELYQMQKLQT